MTACANTEELYDKVTDLDAVIVSTADFQHALHTVEAIRAGRDACTDWKCFLMNRPPEPWDPRKHLEYRLFWPYSDDTTQDVLAGGKAFKY